MLLIYPDLYKDFRCLAGACPDSCCRQGWQIPVDAAHLIMYADLPGKLGKQVRGALVTQDGDVCLRMEHGVCALLREDGLCPIEAEFGADVLCDLCRTHPRFIEVYGGRKEIHLSLSCPEAARLALSQTDPIQLVSEQTDEPVKTLFDADPNEFLGLLGAREAALGIVQERRMFLPDRIVLLLRFAVLVRDRFARKKYDNARYLNIRLLHSTEQLRVLSTYRPTRQQGASYLRDIELLRRSEHLTEDFPALLEKAASAEPDTLPFWEAHETELENLLSLWLAHYFPKAIKDGNVFGRILLAVFLTLAAVQLCVCSGRELAFVAPLLAKELEHSEENLSLLLDDLSGSDRMKHLIAQLPLQQKEG